MVKTRRKVSIKTRRRVLCFFLPFLNFPISCVDNGFIVKAQLVVAACFLEIAANERGKSGKIKERSGEKERERESHTGESSLSSPQFPVAIVARKRTSSNEILQCTGSTHLAQFKLPCGISLLAIRSLFLSSPPPLLSSCESGDSFLQPGHRFHNSNERPLRILITLISREPGFEPAFVTSDHSHPCALSFGRRDSPLCLSIPFLFLPSSVDRSSIVKSNHATIQLYRDKNRYSFLDNAYNRGALNFKR